MTFDSLSSLWAAPPVALAMLALASWARGTRIAHARRWTPELGVAAARGGHWSATLLAIAALLGAVALAGPRWGSRVLSAETKSLNLVIAVDVSRSMLAEDVLPSRLERAKREARRLVHDLAGDRLGLIAFTSQSFVLSPLTIDASAIELRVDALDPTIASAGGTALAPVLDKGRELLFGTTDVADRVLVVFTDGEGHDSVSAMEEAAARLERDGVRLVLVAEGERDPARIPVRDADGALIGFQRDPSDQIVETVRRDDILERVADAAKGVLVPAALDNQARAVRRVVEDYQRAPQSATAATDHVSRAWIPILLAALILLLHTYTRPTLALAALALMLWVPAARAQAPTNEADEAWRAGDANRALDLYREQANQGVGGDTTWFNLGTAALAAGDSQTAVLALGRVSRSLDPDLRFRALFNLGVLDLLRAARDSTNRRTHLQSALERYREALLLNPRDGGAKWNYELALALMPPPSPGPESPSPSGVGAEATETPPERGMSREEAEQILSSMAEAERDTRRDLARRRSATRETRGTKEW